jgi:4-carboxymuconolactone decarboxylase
MGVYEEWERKAQEVRRRIAGPRTGPDLFAAIRELAPEFDELTRTLLVGGIYARPQLDMRTRALCTVAALTVLGKEPLLRRWVDTALAIGCTRQEIIEVVTQMGYYGGVPSAVIGLNAAKDVFEARGVQA